MPHPPLAPQVLDSVRESDDATPLLTLIPWEWAPEGRSSHGRSLLWAASALESSAEEDGMLSVRPLLMRRLPFGCFCPSL